MNVTADGLFAILDLIMELLYEKAWMPMYEEQMLCRFCVTKLEKESATERVVLALASLARMAFP